MTQQSIVVRTAIESDTGPPLRIEAPLEWPSTRTEFEALVERYQDPLARYALRRLGRVQDTEDATRGFFDACAAEDWPRALKFTELSAVPEWIQKNYGGLQIISIGKSFQSGLYCGWYVPYEVRLKDGNIKKYNLAVRNDNPAKQYVEYGGLGY